MALSKQQVEQAKMALLSRQQYPSVDAVRIELGNTGSKSTIHKYLKELDSEDKNNNADPVQLSETIQNFVAQLAKQLQGEADQRIYNVQKEFEEKERVSQEQIMKLNEAQSQLEDKLNQTHQQLKISENNKNQLSTDLHQEQLARQKFEQYAEDLVSQLNQSEQHRQDLLAKFNHAQQSLEHFRESVKEQRHQELRRHDSAIQHLQNEIRLLQQTIAVEKQKTSELNKVQSSLQSEIIQYKESVKKYDLDIADIGSKLKQSNDLYHGLLIEYEKQKNQNDEFDKTIFSLHNQLKDQQKILDHQHDYQALQQQHLVLSTEINLVQKMYNDLIESISKSNKKQDD